MGLMMRYEYFLVKLFRDKFVFFPLELAQVHNYNEPNRTGRAHQGVGRGEPRDPHQRVAGQRGRGNGRDG